MKRATSTTCLLLFVLMNLAAWQPVDAKVACTAHIGKDDIVLTLEFDSHDFTIEQVGSYDYIVGEDLIYPCKAGLPALPQRIFHVAIPPEMRPVGLQARCLESESMGTHNIAPTQPPAVLGTQPKSWTDGREDIYGIDAFYPPDIARDLHAGYMGANRIVSFCVTPFEWNPLTQELILRKHIEVRISTSRESVSEACQTRVAGSVVRALRRVVVNPGDVETFAAGRKLLQGYQTQLSPGEFEYVVVTCDSLAPIFAPLVEWKTSKGVRATCVTREWIETNYPGEDVQAQIRNFIRDAYENWGTVWFLLGGDTQIIPSRTVYAMDCEMGGVAGNRIRCDLYYGDLDGTWNANGVKPYGEVADSVDMYPDVFVGRAPAENIAEAQVFVNKVITYEKNPPAGYALDMLMAGEVMWLDPYTDGGAGLDMIDEDYIPPRFDPILKLYESLGNESRESVLAAMSAGKNFIFHDGHCSEYAMGAGEGYIYSEDADTLSNGSRTFILNSIGCWPAAIDRDCIAEHFLNNPNGGCVAFIGNSRYGWGSPGNPGLGYSDKFQHEFARKVFVDSLLHIGEAHALSKAVFVAFAQDENVYRWNEYQLNLLGDPEMPMWTDEPPMLYVSLPESVMAGGQQVCFTVDDGSGCVRDARVCITNGDDVYEVATTDVSGKATLWVSTSSSDSLEVTVAAFNHRAFRKRIPVVSNGVLLGLTDFSVIDSDDSLANPGETVYLRLKIRNFGNTDASGVMGILRDSDRCQIVDSLIYFGSVGGGSEVSPEDFFEIVFDSTLANAETVTFDLILKDTTSATWTEKVPVVMATPVFSVSSHGLDDRLGGDGDYIPEPGEEIELTVEIANSGLTSGSCDVNLVSLDPYYTVVDTGGYVEEVGSGDFGYTSHRISISGACPQSHIGAIGVTVVSNPYVFTDTVYLAVGDLYYFEDFEAGEGSWTHTGTPDVWHLSNRRSHSDSLSWYFGIDSTHTYPANANASLRSQKLIAGEHSMLSFWFWYDFTTYGTDGIYVVVYRNGVPDTLDFIGSGGALGTDVGALNIYSHWVKWERLLDDFEPGDTLEIEFGFISDDSDQAEGIYIDDVAFASREPVRTGVKEPQSQVALTIFPSPAATSLTIGFGEGAGSDRVDIYSVDGRLVRSIKKTEGQKKLLWDLTDSRGRRVAPGIYLVRAGAQGYAFSGKIVVLR